MQERGSQKVGFDHLQSKESRVCFEVLKISRNVDLVRKRPTYECFIGILCESKRQGYFEMGCRYK